MKYVRKSVFWWFGHVIAPSILILMFAVVLASGHDYAFEKSWPHDAHLKDEVRLDKHGICPESGRHKHIWVHDELSISFQDFFDPDEIRKPEVGGFREGNLSPPNLRPRPSVTSPDPPEQGQTPDPPTPEQDRQVNPPGSPPEQKPSATPEETQDRRAENMAQPQPSVDPPKMPIQASVEPKPISVVVDILNVEFFENPDRLIVTLKNNMEEPFVMCEGFGKFELRRLNGKLHTSSNFRLVNLTFRKTTLPILLPGETARLYLASFADYNALIPLYHKENVQHYVHIDVRQYHPRQSLVLYYIVDGRLQKVDTHPEPVAGAPRLLRPKLITTWGALKQ